MRVTESEIKEKANKEGRWSVGGFPLHICFFPDFSLATVGDCLGYGRLVGEIFLLHLLLLLAK